MTLTFNPDLDTINVHHHTKFGDHKSNGSEDMNFCPVTFCLVNFGQVTDGQTDRQTESDAYEPPVISTGVLKKLQV